MRRIPVIYQAAPPDLDATSALWRCSVDLRALTPIYKGAANPQGIDEAYPFRGPSIRGQLRMWWRAVHETTSLDTLRADEKRLFGGVFDSNGRGGAVRASRVSVGVTEMSSTPAHRNELRGMTGGSYDYALWVDRKSGDAKQYHVDASGRLHVSVAALGTDTEPGEADVERLKRALRAMVWFGGSGSRSRRGMGVLWSDELLGRAITDPTSAARAIAELAPPVAERAWPSLAGATVAWHGSTQSKAGKAIDQALADLKDLRGMRSTGGRNFTGAHREQEAQDDWLAVRDGRAPNKAFVAGLGMPLAYRSSNGHLQGTTMITPEGRDRMPSPLHVRAVPTGGGFAPVILALRPWFHGSIQAKNRSRGTQRGSLNPDAVRIALGGLAKRGWAIQETP